MQCTSTVSGDVRHRSSRAQVEWRTSPQLKAAVRRRSLRWRIPSLSLSDIRKESGGQSGWRRTERGGGQGGRNRRRGTGRAIAMLGVWRLSIGGVGIEEGAGYRKRQ